ncbi:hypothetical protein BGZ94_002535 [Podila epigama]|nr:hypothetical protein BGZ94_002535 [Podila epigama]
MFGSAFAPGGGANVMNNTNGRINSNNNHSNDNSFNQFSNNQTNWHDGTSSGRGRGRGGGNAFRGGRGGGNMTYVAPGLANSYNNSNSNNNNHSNVSPQHQHQHQQQQQSFQSQPYQQQRRDTGYSRGRGRGGGSGPGHFKSLQWRPDNTSNTATGQNSEMEDSSMTSETGSWPQQTGLGQGQVATSTGFGQRNGSAFMGPGSFGASTTTTPVFSTAAGSGSAFNQSNPAVGTVFSATSGGSAFETATAPSSSSMIGSSGFSFSAAAAASNITPGGNSISSAFASAPHTTGLSSSSSPSSGTAFGGGSAFSGGSFGKESALYTSSTNPSSGEGPPSTIRSLKSQDSDIPEDAESRLARFTSVPIGNRYEELKEKRIQERRDAIKNGTIPDPDKPRRLEDAIEFVGTCTDMCPEFERHEREYQQNVESFEKIPGTEKIDHARAVKIYARSAAGTEQALPSDVRPPKVLLSTLDYLIKDIVAQGDLADSHGFVRDRTRSIRQDFTLQNSRGLEAIEAHEVIARYHILCIHQLCEVKTFSNQQEMEQLRKVLTSLQEFYDDMRSEGITCPNEAEFRAYHMLSHMWDPDMLRQAQQLPHHIFKDPFIQAAAEIHMISRRNNDIRRRAKVQSEASPNFFSRFFKKIAGPGTTYLMACLVETNFAEIRKGALKAMNKTYLDMHGGVPINDLVESLGFDDVDECIANCDAYGLEISQGPQPTVVFNRRDPETRRRIFKEGTLAVKQHRNERLVEAKRQHYSTVQIIYGQTPGPSEGKGTMSFKSGVASRLGPGLSTQRTNGTRSLTVAGPPTVPPLMNAFKPTAPMAPKPATQAPGAFFFGVDTPEVAALGTNPILTKKQSVFETSSSFSSTKATAAVPSSLSSSLSGASGKQPQSIKFDLAPGFPSSSAAVSSSVDRSSGISSTLNPSAIPFKPTAPLPLQPAAVIPPSNTSNSFSSQTSQASPFIFKAPVPATQASTFSGATKAPSFEFKAPTMNTTTTTSTVTTAPSTPTASSGGFSLGAAKSKSFSGFAGTISTAPPFTVSTPTIHQTAVLLPPPSPISTPKTDAMTIVTRRGRIYPRSVVEAVLNGFIQEEMKRIVRPIAAQAVHDEAVERSLRRANERKRAVRVEEAVIMSAIVDNVTRELLADIWSEIYRETKVQRRVIQKWKAFAAESRRRAEELRRRREHFLLNVRAMSSRGGLGEDEMAIKIRDYKAEQDRLNKQRRPIMDQYEFEQDGGRSGVKAMAEAVNRKRQKLMDLGQEGSPDDALLAILMKAAAPKKEMWTSVLVHEIVEEQYKRSHPLSAQTLVSRPWRLFLNLPDFKETSSKWLLSKLGTNMGRGTKVLQRAGNMTTVHQGKTGGSKDVVVHGITDESLTDLLGMARETIMETSALMFVFSTVSFPGDQATESVIRNYWHQERDRLVRFLACFPRVKQPMVFVIWGEQSMWETISPRVVEYLELDEIVRSDRSGVSKYRFLVMDMANMKLDRYIAGSLEWLATETRDPIDDPSVQLSRIALV